ncbi:MAG: Nif3-like dinuclear metal center hexameric protein [Candidatus Lokiarchaeota archaeon]|nr:Nif3-like dinuclear metal center hexameric protein [Candidatus Lokiarchaeota archaeon]
MLLNQLTDYFNKIVKNFNFVHSNEFLFQIGPLKKYYTEKVIKKVLITQYLTTETIRNAIKKNCNLILCRFGFDIHHPFQIDEIAQKDLFLLLHNRLMVCLIPDCFDYLPYGPIPYLANIISLNFSRFLIDRTSSLLGAIYQTSKEAPLTPIIDKLHRNLNLNHVQVFINKHSWVKTFLICDMNFPPPNLVSCAKYNNCDCIISAITTPHILHHLQLYEISFLHISFHCLIESSLHKFCNNLSLEFPRIEFEFYPTKNPLSFIHRKQNH